MSKVTGLREIMEDIAKTTAESHVCVDSETPGSAPKSGNMLNLSIGNPASISEVETKWQEIVESVSTASLESTLFSYGPSRGDHALIKSIVDYFRAVYGWDISEKNVVVGPGSQFLAFSVATLYSGRSHDGKHRPIVAPILPEYTGYQGISANSEELIGIPPIVCKKSEREFRYLLDSKALSAVESAGLFLVSNPSNPAGRGLQSNELSEIVNKSIDLDSVVMIDHAYGSPFPTVAKSPTAPIWHSNILNCFSLSKAGLPGARVGFVIGPEKLIDSITSFISNSCLHANRAAQKLLKHALEGREIDNLSRNVIAPYYQAKTEFALKLAYKHFPESINWRHHRTKGGMFLWLWIDEPWFDDLEFYTTMKEIGVFITPGRHFFLGQESFQSHMKQCVRISLSPNRSTLEMGISLIGKTLQRMNHAAS